MSKKHKKPAPIPPVEPPPSVEPPPEPEAKRPSGWLAIAIVAGLCVLGAGLVWWSVQNPPPAPTPVPVPVPIVVSATPTDTPTDTPTPSPTATDTATATPTPKPHRHCKVLPCKEPVFKCDGGEPVGHGKCD